MIPECEALRREERANNKEVYIGIPSVPGDLFTLLVKMVSLPRNYLTQDTYGVGPPTLIFVTVNGTLGLKQYRMSQLVT